MLKKTLATLVLLTACHDRVIAVQAPPADTAKPGQMTVNGQARLEISPDCADLTMVITADGAKPGVATSQAEAEENAVVANLRAQGVGNKDMKLSSLQLEPEMEWVKDHYFLKDYRAQITITVTTRDFSKLAALMDAGSSAGVTQMSSQFRRSDLDKLKKEVRMMAIAAAKEKAESTAKALGIKLGRVTSVAENAGGYMWSNAYFPRARDNVNVSDTRSDGQPLGGDLQPLTLDITVGYELAVET